MDDVSCEEPLIIPFGLLAILSQVVWVILPLKTYLLSYEDVSCEEPLIVPAGIVAWIPPTPIDATTLFPTTKSIPSNVGNICVLPDTFVKNPLYPTGVPTSVDCDCSKSI